MAQATSADLNRFVASYGLAEALTELAVQAAHFSLFNFEHGNDKKSVTWQRISEVLKSAADNAKEVEGDYNRL